MPRIIVLTVGGEGGGPTLADLKWLLDEANRAGAGNPPVGYVPPLPGGDPDGWGLRIELEEPQ